MTPDAGVLTASPRPPADPSGTASGSTPSVSESTPTAVGAALRDRVKQVGLNVRPAVVFFDTNGFPTGVAGVFLEPSLVVTAASALNATAPEFRTAGDETYEALLVGRTTPSDGGDDGAAFRTEREVDAPRWDSPGPVAGGPGGPRRPSPVAGQLARPVRVCRGSDRDRWLSGQVRSVPTPGGALVTLDGESVGITVGRVGSDPPSTEVPPPTEPPAV